VGGQVQNLERPLEYHSELLYYRPPKLCQLHLPLELTRQRRDLSNEGYTSGLK
jgi:hypothetical protein